jgi:hypothetical protein
MCQIRKAQGRDLRNNCKNHSLVGCKSCSSAKLKFQKEQKENETIRHVQEAAKQDPIAMYKLGLCHEAGVGGQKNFCEAVKCFRLAAKLNCAEGLYALGRCYLKGTGVPKLEEEGVRLLHEATVRVCNALFFIILIESATVIILNLDMQKIGA